MKRHVKYCNMLIHFVYLCVHESWYLCVDFFPAAKVRCANFGQFLYWPVTRCVLCVRFYGVVGGEIYRQVHKKFKGPRTMSQDGMPKGVRWCATQGH